MPFPAALATGAGCSCRRIRTLSSLPWFSHPSKDSSCLILNLVLTSSKTSPTASTSDEASKKTSPLALRRSCLFQVVSKLLSYDFCILRCRSCSPSLTCLTILVVRPRAQKWLRSQDRESCDRAYQERGLCLPRPRGTHPLEDPSR